MLTIFELTFDFQCLHMLPNANGRISQIIRDCFAMHQGKLPYSALTSMSHYGYLFDPVDKEHLNFMQEHTEKKLSAIEEKSLTIADYRYTTREAQDKLLASARNNPAIEHDVNNFMALLTK